MGESVIGWDDADYRYYHIQRLCTDSLLQALKPHCRDYVCPAQIDTLRTLLTEKEAHLLYLTEILARQDEADSFLVNHLPKWRAAHRRLHMGNEANEKLIKLRRNLPERVFADERACADLTAGRACHFGNKTDTRADNLFRADFLLRIHALTLTAGVRSVVERAHTVQLDGTSGVHKFAQYFAEISQHRVAIAGA